VHVNETEDFDGTGELAEYLRGFTAPLWIVVTLALALGVLL
jgi:hypothetical protein